MAVRHSARIAPGRILTFCVYAAVITTLATAGEGSNVPLTVASGTISISGTSNIHAYTASTKELRAVRVQLARGVAGPTFWDDILKPGAIEAFEIAIPAATLSSPKEGLDKNMHKALKVSQYADIRFRLVRLEAKPATLGAFRVDGALLIAGVEREVAFDLVTRLNDSTLMVKGEVPLLMTDFGITPPKAMLGMLKTDPKVTVTFEAVLAIPLT